MLGSGCGAVGRAVAFKTRGPRFGSSHRQNFIEHLFIINCIEKSKINKKEAGNGPLFFKKKIVYVSIPQINTMESYKSVQMYVLNLLLLSFVCLSIFIIYSSAFVFQTIALG